MCRLFSDQRARWLLVCMLPLALGLGACLGSRIPSKPLVILDYHDRASRAAILIKDLDVDVRIRRPDPMPYSHNASTALWVGSRFPADKAIAAIQAARHYYRELRYVALSDRLPGVPEPIHYQLFVGGSTETALRMGLRAWTPDDFAALKDIKDRAAFHEFIQARYGDKPFLKPRPND